MAMDERDRIDIIATLHDRFNKPADEIIRKMERMERQADDTGDSIDGLEESLDEESRTTRDNTKAFDENTKSRDKHSDAVDDQGKALAQSNRHLRANTDAVRDSIAPTQKAAQAHEEAAEATQDHGDAIERSRGAQRLATNDMRESRKILGAHTRTVNQARDAMVRMTETTDKNTESLRRSTQASKQARDERGRFTKATKEDAKAWDKWNTKVKKITGSIGNRFRPVGAFFQNYFKILGAFRAMLFSDIGAMIPQLITGIVAIGSAANATLAPLGRLLGNLGQIAPLIAAFAQTKVVFGFVKDGIGDALKVLNDTNATLEDLNKAQKELGDNTWDTAKALKQMGENFEPIKKAVRETFLEGMAPALGDLSDTYFPLLQKELTNTAGIMNGELREGLKGLQTPEKQKTIADVMERSSVASGLFVDIAWSLLDVFIELADAAGPAFLDTLEAVDGILDRFAGWIRDNKEGLTDFFNRSNDTAGNFFRGIGFILTGLSGISQAAKPLEDFLYGGLLDRLEGWSERMNDPAAQEEMRENYERMIPNLEAIGNLIGAILDGFKTVGESEYFAPLVNDLAENTIPLIFEYIKKLDETVGPPLMRIGDALSQMDPGVLTSILNPLGDALGALAWVLETVVPLFSALPRPMQEMVMYGAGLAAMGLPGLFMLLLGPLRLVDAVLKAFTERGLLARVKDGFEGLKKSFKGFKDTKLGKWLATVGSKFKSFFKPIGEFLKRFLPKGSGGLLARIFGKIAGKGVLAAIPVIGTVIGVLWLLWDVISWLWKNVEPFRNFVMGIWDWIVMAWKASIDWIVNTAVPWVVGAFLAIWDGIKAVGEWIGEFYTKWIKPIVDGFIWLGKIIFVTVATIAIVIGSVIGWIWKKLLWPFMKWFWGGFGKLIWEVLKWIGGLFVWLWEAAKWAWGGIVIAGQWLWDGLKWLVGAIADGFVWLWEGLKIVWGGIVDGFVWLRDKIAAVWAWVKDNIITPVINWFISWAVPLFKWIVGAVVNGFIWLRDKVTAVWAWIKENVIAPVVNWFMTWALPLIKNVISWLVGAFEWLRGKVTAVWAWIKDTVIGPTSNWFRDVIWPKISAVVGWLVDKFNWLRDRVSSAWDWIKDKIYGVYTDHIDPTIEKFKSAINTLKESFDVAKEAIGKAWDTIKDKAKEPVAFVIDKVYNEGIRPVWNNLAEAVNLDTRLAEVKWASRGYDTGGYTGPGSKYQPAGVVHADEFVIKKSSQRSLRRDAPGLLDALNDHGSKALGYDSGGWVKPFQGNYASNSPYGQRGGRLHAGMDFPTPSGTPLTAVSAGSVVDRSRFGPAGNKLSLQTDMKGIIAGYHHMSRFIASVGQQVSKGQIIGYSGNTGRSTGPHLHFSIKRDGKYVDPAPYLRGAGIAGTGEGGGWGWINPFDGMLDRFLNKLPGSGGFKDIAVASITKMVNGAKDWALSHADILGGAVDMASGAVDTLKTGATAARWSFTAARALRHTGDYTRENLASLLARISKESGGDPRAINTWDSNAKRGTPSKGLMQVIQPTFNAHRDRSLANDIYDPMANIVAAIRYTKSRYSSLQSGWGRPGGYFNGGLVNHMRYMGGPVETWGNTLVGEFGPEIFIPDSVGAPSILGLTGPELVSFDREGSILPHQAVAALSTVSNAPSSGGDTLYEDNHYDINVTVGAGATEVDVERAVKKAIHDIERKKKERR